MKKSTQFFKVLAIIGCILLTIVLVYESCMPGDVSSSHSSTVSNTVTDVTGKVESAISGGKTDISDGWKANFSEFHHTIRKGFGHFGAFMILGLFATIALANLAPKKSLGIFIAYFYGLFFAVFTEAIQLSVPGRAGVFDDVALDFSGFFTGLKIVTITWWGMLLIMSKKRKRI